MTDKPFFDTSILVYTIGQHDARTPVAESLLANGGVISVQVMNELASVGRRTLALSWPEVADALGAIRVLCPAPLPVSAETHDAAVSIATRYGFHIYDALIAASALEAGCSMLFSEDMQSGQVIDDRLTILNPFVSTRSSP